jgi:hypothetical protein
MMTKSSKRVAIIEHFSSIKFQWNPFNNFYDDTFRQTFPLYVFRTSKAQKGNFPVTGFQKPAQSYDALVYRKISCVW